MTRTSFTETAAAIITAVLALGPMTGQPAAAQVQVAIPQMQLDAALASCTSAEACAAAIDTLVAGIVAANPGVDVAPVLGSILSAVASAYNAGTLPAAVASVALGAISTVASANGAAQVVAAVSIAASAVEAGDTIDIEAVTEASGSPT